MSDIRIALVAEGPTDYVVIEAALKAILAPRAFILTQLQPEPTQPAMGSGWGGVLKWCYETSRRHIGSLDDDPTLSNFDLIIIHLDVDVSTFRYADCGADIVALSQHYGWLGLPCARQCPPASDSADALENVLSSWLGGVTLGSHSALCFPAQSSGMWLAAATLNAGHPLLLNAECNIGLEDGLSHLNKATKIKKTKRDYQAKANNIVNNWQTVKALSIQAQRFESAIIAAI